MKINRCYISSFGNFKNFSCELKDGLNVIEEENGWGKTTLASFIKCMFYGIDNGKKLSVNDSDRKKYKPWNSTEKFGGYIEFDWGNYSYKIERYFGNKESEDTVRLFDLKTGRESLATADLGRRIFEIDESGFTLSTYLSQRTLENAPSKGLIEKFNSAFSSQSENYDAAITALKNKIKEYKSGTDKGKINRIKKQIIDCDYQTELAKEALKAYSLTERDLKELNARLCEIKSETEKLDEKIKKLSSADTARVKKERYALCENKINELTEKLKETEFILNGNYPTDNELEAYFACVKDLEKTESYLESAKRALSEIENLSEEKPERSKKSKTSIIACSVFDLALFIAAAVLIILGYAAYSAIPAILAVALVAVLLFYIKGKNKKDDKTYSTLLQNKKEEIAQYGAIAKTYTQKIRDFFDKFKKLESEDYYGRINEIKNALKKREEILSEIKKEEENLKIYSQDKTEFENADLRIVEKENSEEMNLKLNALKQEEREKSREAAEKESRLRVLDEKVSRIADLESNKELLEEELKAATEEYEILIKTGEFLSGANDAVVGRYRKPLEEGFEKYLSYITKNVNYKPNIDVKLNLSIEENGLINDTAYYSEGYKNLFELCKRFALIDVLFTGEKPFLILDDPFYNMDENKIKESLALLKILAKEYQIIYLVCHPSRSV